MECVEVLDLSYQTDEKLADQSWIDSDVEAYAVIEQKLQAYAQCDIELEDVEALHALMEEQDRLKSRILTHSLKTDEDLLKVIEFWKLSVRDITPEEIDPFSDALISSIEAYFLNRTSRVA